MRIVAITHLERSIGGPRLAVAFDGENPPIEATQMYTFQNGWTLLLLESHSIEGNQMILVNRDREVSLSIGKPEFTLKPERAQNPVLDGPCPVDPTKKYRECVYCWEKMPHPEAQRDAAKAT